MKYKRNEKTGMHLLILLLSAIMIISLSGCRDAGAEDPDVRRDEEPQAQESSSEEAQPEEASESKESDEDIIRKDVEEKLGTASITAEEFAAAMRADSESAEIYEMANIDVDEYSASLVKHMRTEIQAITVNGNKGDVKVLMTMPDFDAMDKVLDEMIKAYSADENNATKDADEMYADIGAMMMELVSREDLPEKTEEIDVSYTKVADSWTMDDAAEVMSKLENTFLVD